jgi:hypothetical protein
MESKKINQLATELAPDLSDLTIIGDPTTGISKKITLSQMASLFTGTVEEYPNLASFPLVGVADTIYIALDTNIIYRWNTGTNAYVELSPNIVTSLVFNDANGFDGTINLVGSTATLTITTALTQGSVPFIGTSGALTQDNANLFFDDTNNRLGINTNAPTTALDVFGSGIIGRLNGTSTNNAFLGFANAGTNRWSIGNVQSDHRFRIFSETNTSELVTVLQTGEFGIGIANPTTKIHIDGGATALIANLDANVSVAKSLSFRSDNSNRINLEVSGTESGSNAGANLFIRTYTDAGALLATPITITRSNANVSFSTTIDVATTLLLSATTIEQNTSAGLTLNASNASGAIYFRTNGAQRLSIGSSGIATFSSTVTATKVTAQESNSSGSTEMVITNTSNVSAITKTAQLLFKLADTGGTLKDSGYIKSVPEGVNVLDAGLVFGTRSSDATNDRMFLSNGGILSLGGANTVQSTDKPHFFRMSGGGLGISANNEGSGNQPISFYTSGTQRISISSIGAVSINAPTTTADALNVQGAANYNTIVIAGSSTSSQSYGLFIKSGTTSSDYALLVRNQAASVNYFQIRGDGYLQSVSTYNNTTATGANLSISTSGFFERSTSSIRFKTNVEDLTIDTKSILSKMRPIWYRSLGQNDRKDWSWYGFIAEELAELEPRLVNWGYDESSYEEIEIIDEEGNIKKETKLTDDAQLIPDGVQYERITVLLVAELQKMRKELDELKAK